MDTDILTTPPPGISPADAVAVARSLFGVEAATARDVGSERDRAFILEDAEARPLAVLKISNAAEDPAVLDMEAGAALHAIAADPGLPIALPWRVRNAADGNDPADLRAEWRDGDASHWCRLYDVLPGSTHIDPGGLSDPALAAWGEMAARLGVALRGFTHRCARRPMLWDPQYALQVRPMIDAIDDASQRELVERSLDEFERSVLPVWPRLRAQVLHADLSVNNVLTDEAGRITGIVDFGDMSHTALVTDLAAVLDTFGQGRSGDELFRAARLVIDGYQRVVELEDLELDVLGPLWAARCAVAITIGAWRVANGLVGEWFTELYSPPAVAAIRTMLDVGWPETSRRLGAASAQPRPDLAERRAIFGPTMEALSYDVPVEVASADGVWITDTDGVRYLDVYNNVPCVGHGHPRVRTAIARQSRRINTHMRYLHPAAIELAERLVDTCPPGLDTVLLVNSGSEANDLAWRLATRITGATGGLCTAFAYHGMTEATDALSPETWFDGPRPAHVERWEPPDAYRGEHLGPEVYADALARLSARGLRPAAAILDGLLMSDRVSDLEPGYVQELVRMTHAAGGLWIADEVQAGHGRTGEALWAFQRHGVVPDFVTLGKPMGNGHPVAAVITRRELLAAIPGQSVFFSTYGGNPVSAAAALAVLDVIEDERVLERVREAGEALRAGLMDVAGRHQAIGDVRVVGLACGVEIVADRGTKAPDRALTTAVKNGLRHRGVLVGTTGRDGNILKIRPPLAFTAEHVPVLVAALDGALASR
jgi:4-aminobutyrate aminotransferase-like enzyme/Ser/Thr protein kinase RdoA (MazF antagonist)